MRALSRFLPLAACCGALAALWAVALLSWDSLPASIPVHFDLAGRPDRAGAKTWGNWLLAPIVLTALTGLLVALALSLSRLARARPEWINLPEQARFRALEPEVRARVVGPIASLLLLVAALVDLLGVYILAGSAAIAAGRWTRLPWAPLVAVVAAVLATTMIAVLGARRSIREADAAARAR